MTTPAETHQALAAAIERVAEVARAAKVQRDSPISNTANEIVALGWVLHDPASVLARTDRDRERAERHRPGPLWADVPRCDMQLHAIWPCSDYRDLLLDYGIEVP